MWRPLWADIRGLVLPGGSWWVAWVTGLTCFLIVAGTTSLAVDDAVIVGVLAVGGSVLAAWGQVLAAARLRSWSALLAMALAWGLVWVVAVALAALGVDSVGTAAFVLAFVAPLFMLPGFLSLRTSSLASVSLLGPLVWYMAAIVQVANSGEGLQRWRSDARHAVWSSVSAPILLLAVGTSLAWMWARERRRVTTWVAAGTADARVQRITRLGTPQWASGLGAALLAVLFAVAVTTGTGMLAPYLWQSSAEEAATVVVPEPGAEPPSADSVSGGCNSGIEEVDKRVERTVEDVQVAAERTVSSLLLIGLTLALLVLCIGVFGLPLRRLLLVRRLISPPWERPPSEQVTDAWALARIALDDVGVARKRGESASAHAARGVAAMPGLIELGPLTRCARLADGSAYAFGVAPDAPDRALRDAEVAYEAVWLSIGEWERVRALYRWI